MILNIRGTSGCGKSTLVRMLMRTTGSRPIYSMQNGKSPTVVGYESTETVDVVRYVGRYATDCGGCDTIRTQDEAERRVRAWNDKGHVIFEGLLISHIYGRWSQLAKDCKPFLFVFLDVPLEVCIERVKQRRMTSSRSEKPFNPKNTIDKWNDMRRVSAKAIADGHCVKWWKNEENNQEAYREIIRCLKLL